MDMNPNLTEFACLALSGQFQTNVDAGAFETLFVTGLKTLVK